MVADKIDNCELYYGLHPSMEKAFAFIRRYCEEPVKPGRYELEGEALYAMVVAYRPEPRETLRYESHDRYIDIQCVMEGSEYQGYIPREEAEVSVAYEEEKDIRFHAYDEKDSRLRLTKGMFAIYFPQDAHLPSMWDGCTEECIRIVVKMKC